MTNEIETTETELLGACEGLLSQLEGAAMVCGNGCGNDGKKTGLSQQEFVALRNSRLDAARTAIAKAKARKNELLEACENILHAVPDYTNPEEYVRLIRSISQAAIAINTG